MLRDSEEATAWLRMADPMKNWSDWPLALDKPSLLSSGTVQTLELVEKADDGKLAHDVDDLSAIFEGLVDGADITLPCDDMEEVAASEDAWIDSLEDDVMNVNELSAAFDALVEEQQEDSSSDEDEDMEEAEAPVKIIPSAPVWATQFPLDPRSCIRTPVFKNLDSRIPRAQVPRMDLSFSSNGAAVKTVGALGPRQSVQSMSPKHTKAKVAAYHHDPKTCWICKSSKTPEKKRALHRYHEKRTRRNWKRGPRYSGRSNVATSRTSMDAVDGFCLEALPMISTALKKSSSKFLNDKKKKLLAFKSTTNANDSMAKSYLEKFSWDLMRAVDEFFANGGESLTPVKKSTISMDTVNAWFDSYL
uniref:Uncharacterized protein n=1 Tax=Phytophthora ramorum TaxID=164328 RepID=H3GMS7_PHYRM